MDPTEIVLKYFYLVRWAGSVASTAERRRAYVVLVGNPEGNRPLRRPRSRWENIRIYLKEIVLEVK
jgi:hypothetical protein